MNALLGATLIDLQELLQSNIQEISAVFTWRLAIFNFSITRIVNKDTNIQMYLMISLLSTPLTE